MLRLFAVLAAVSCSRLLSARRFFSAARASIFESTYCCVEVLGLLELPIVVETPSR